MLYLGDEANSQVNGAVQALYHRLKAQIHPAVVEVTPGNHSLMIEFDPVRIRADQVEELLTGALSSDLSDRPKPQVVEIPVRYDGETGPDLGYVAEHTGLSTQDVVRLHADREYLAYCLGFAPGFCYLGTLDPALHTPRRTEPRTRVPAGSVAIGGSQTGFYPQASPGGWHVIGRTPMRLFNPYAENPSRIMPGDLVRFVPIDAEEYQHLVQAPQADPPVLPAYSDGKTGIRVVAPGLLTTIQDLGRRGYMSLGVPVAGAVDFVSLMIGNWLLGNRARTAALEVTLNGPELEFTGPVAFCLTGAPIPAELIPADGSSPRPVPGWTTVLAWPGDRLRTGTAERGCRAYLCVAGGIDLPPVLGSLSEDLFGQIGPLGRALRAGDWLPAGLPLHPPADLAGRRVPPDGWTPVEESLLVRATRGPQAQAFTEAALATFYREPYTVGTQSDRQGLRLEGEALKHRQGADILSEPIPPGSVQVPASGQPILLVANRHTHGGYTKIATVLYSDLAACGQLRPGSTLRFAEIDQVEAHHLAWAERRKLAQIRRVLQREFATSGAQHHSQGEAPDLSAPLSVGPGAATPVRTFRITIGDIAYTAEVEEIE